MQFQVQWLFFVSWFISQSEWRHRHA